MKDPAMLFYASDFLTGVALMSMKERGQYITLLCLQQQRGHLTLSEMRKAAGALSAEVLGKFVEDENGKFYNIRADREIARRAAHCDRQRKNVEARWKKEKDTYGHDSGNTNGTPKGNTVVLPLEMGNRNNNITPVISTVEPDKKNCTDTVRDHKDLVHDFGNRELNEAFAEWVRYKTEKRQAYKPTGLANLIAQVERYAAQYTPEAVAGLIRDCMASNWAGIIFDRLRSGNAAKKGLSRGQAAAEDMQQFYRNVANWAIREDEQV